ncbi:MAG: hypothetical protein KC422_20295 [Trueperaceae bacterium]|nr:hypothetical protein [Trueperaceae bacterium]
MDKQEQIQIFSDALWQGNSTELRCIHPKGGIQSMWGSLKSPHVIDKATRLNGQGFDVFAVINQPKPETKERIEQRDPETGKRRLTRDCDIDSINAIFCETDKPEVLTGDNLQAFISSDLPPSMVIRSSYPNHLHAYWLTRDTPVTMAKPLCEAVIRYYDASPESKNPARVLRVPGCIHQKSGLMVTLVHFNGKDYDFADLAGFFQPVLPQAPSVRRRIPYQTCSNEVIRRLMKGCETVAANMQGAQGRHRRLFWAAINCKNHHMPLEQARGVVCYMADCLPTREGNPVPHFEALSVLEHVYSSDYPLGEAWAFPKKQKKGQKAYLKGVWSR